MRSGSDTLKAIVKSSHSPQFIADLYVGRDRVLQDVPLEDVSLTWDGDAQVLCSGTVSIIYSDDFGGSIAPREQDSWLSPFGSWMEIRYRVSMGGFSETVTLGRLAVQEPSDPELARIMFQGQLIVTGSRISVDLADAFAITDRERFAVPSQPAPGSYAWAELASLSGWPIRRTLDDAIIPNSVTYQESRLDALFDIGSVLGGVPFMDSDQTLTLRPFEWPEASFELTDGEDGEVISVEVDSWDTSTVYNEVVIRAEDDDQSPILARARILDGRLRWGLPSEGAWGRIPLFASSPYVTTSTQAQGYADSLLKEKSQLTVVSATVTIVPNPLLQVGDVGWFPLDGVRTLGRIQKITLGTGDAQELVMACG